MTTKNVDDMNSSAGCEHTGRKKRDKENAEIKS